MTNDSKDDSGYVYVTDNKDMIRKMIFDGTEEKAIELCREICRYNIYDGMCGFGLYLSEARRAENPGKARKLADQLSKSLTLMFDGNKEETNHVWIVLQEVLKFLAGTAPDDFKKKVKEGNKP